MNVRNTLCCVSDSVGVVGNGLESVPIHRAAVVVAVIHVKHMWERVRFALVSTNKKWNCLITYVENGLRNSLNFLAINFYGIVGVRHDETCRNRIDRVSHVWIRTTLRTLIDVDAIDVETLFGWVNSIFVCHIERIGVREWKLIIIVPPG